MTLNNVFIITSWASQILSAATVAVVEDEDNKKVITLYESFKGASSREWCDTNMAF